MEWFTMKPCAAASEYGRFAGSAQTRRTLGGSASARGRCRIAAHAISSATGAKRPRIGVRARSLRSGAHPERAGRAMLRVSNSGPGIPAEELPHIWDRLFRGDRSRAERGLGLGLSLVKAIVEAHGGSVSVTSEPGKGSTFLASFPASA